MNNTIIGTQSVLQDNGMILEVAHIVNDKLVVSVKKWPNHFFPSEYLIKQTAISGINQDLNECGQCSFAAQMKNYFTSIQAAKF